MGKRKRVLGDGAECCGGNCELCAKPEADEKVESKDKKDDE